MKKKLTLHKKEGLSGVVTTLLIVGVSIIAVGLLWASTSKVIKSQIGNSEACYGASDKVQLSSRDTCYEGVEGGYRLRFQVKVADIDLDGLIISIYSGGESRGYTINTTNQVRDDLIRYPVTVPAKDLVVPSANEGLSYKTSNFTSTIDQIEIAPIINEVQCGVSDSLADIESCDLLV